MGQLYRMTCMSCLVWRPLSCHVPHSAIKTNEITSFTATWMQLEILTLAKLERQTPYDVTSMESKICHRWTCLQNRNRLPDMETRLVVAEGSGGGCSGEFGLSRCKLWHWEWISSEVLLSRTGDSVSSHLWWNMTEDTMQKCEYRRMTASLSCTSEMDRTV